MSAPGQEDGEQRRSGGAGTALVVVGCALIGAAAGYAGRSYQKSHELDHKKDDDSYVSHDSNNLALGVRSARPYMDDVDVNLDDDEMEFA